MRKTIVIAIILTCIISPLIIISSKEVKTGKNDTRQIDNPKIFGCYNIHKGRGEKVEQGYATWTYSYLLKNTKKETIGFEIDWGDKTSKTYDDTSDSIYVPHTYKTSGTYNIKVRYSNENKWSEPFTIEMVDFYDINVKSIYSKPSNFRPRQKISLCVDLENIGTIPTTKSSKVVFYHIKDDKNEEVIAESNVGIIQPGDTETVEVLFKWFNDKEEHTIYVEVQEINGERNSVNNFHYEYLRAQSIVSLFINSIKSRIHGLLEG